MKKLLFVPVLLLSLFLCACTRIGEKTASATFIYGAMALLSAFLLLGYFILIKRKNRWFFVLFTCITVVNSSYFALSVSSTLDEALWANRIAYLASVFMIFSTVMIILKIGDFRYPRYLPYAFGALCTAVFLIAASQGFCGLYYREVSLVSENGVSSLAKVYGPLHSVYFYFLLGGFLTIIFCTVLVFYKHRLEHRAHCAMLACAMFINLTVWLIEQLVDLDFEFLCVSYCISELFLLVLSLMLQEQARMIERIRAEVRAHGEKTQTQEAAERFASLLPSLTRTERVIYDLYTGGKRSREILELLSITENTLKYHNRNIYSKLGISSRKELLGCPKE